MLKDTLNKHGFTFSKKYGQNFISDPNLLAAIAESGAESGDTVVEIGAGAGTLTKALCNLGAKVTAFEIDKRLQPILAETLGDSGADLIFADVLKYDMDSLNLGNYRVVANLPYYVTTPIIFKLLYDERLMSITVMVQSEVAERMRAQAGTAEYGALSAQMQVMGNVKLVRQVPRTAFYPVPNVDSAVVRLDIDPRCDRSLLPHYRRAVAAAFAMRRKTLANNLTAAYSLNKTDAENLVLSVCGNKSARGETFTVEQFIRLAEALKK